MTIYEELTARQANNNIIPSTSNMTFAEQAAYVAEYSSLELKNLFESIGIDELAIYESTGYTVIYEGAKLTELKTKIKEFFMKIWEAIKAAYNAIIEFFQEKINEAKTKISSKVFLSKIEKLSGSKEYGKVHEYKFEKVESDIIAPANDFLSIIPDIYTRSMRGKEGSEGSELVKLAKETKDNIEEKIYNIYNVNKKSASEIKSAISKKFISEKTISVTKNWLTNNANDIVDVCLGTSYKKDITKAYKGEKALIDKAIKSAQDTVSKCYEFDCTRYLVDSYKTLSNCLHTACCAYADAMKKRYHEYLVILTRVAVAKTE